MRNLADDGMTMLVVTHEMNFARNVSSKIVFMDEGEVIETADPETFFQDPKEERAKTFVQGIISARN
jgi:ABC-type polar amino acid transport system ATPase subunit